jgi:hypothetical protein
MDLRDIKTYSQKRNLNYEAERTGNLWIQHERLRFLAFTLHLRRQMDTKRSEMCQTTQIKIAASDKSTYSQDIGHFFLGSVSEGI